MNIQQMSAAIPAKTMQTAQGAKNSDVKTRNCLWGGFWGYMGAFAIADCNRVAGLYKSDIQSDINSGLSKDGINILRKLGGKKPLQEEASEILSIVPNKGLELIGELKAASQSKFGVMNILKNSAAACKLAAAAVIWTAVCSRNKKAPEGQELSKKDKFTNYVRQNAGKLSMLAFVPFAIYSCANAARNIVSAHKLLPKSMISDASAFECAGAFKDVLAVPLMGLAAVCGVRVKDFMQNRKDQKTIAQAK